MPARSALPWVLSERRRVLIALYVVALVPRVFLALAQPVWARVDEAFHADYVAHLARGAYPVEGRTLILPEIEGVMKATGVYRWDPYNMPEPDPEAWRSGPPSGMSSHARIVWMQRNIWRYSYEAFQPPTYYALMVPLWATGSTFGGIWGAIYALRLFNAVVGAAVAPLAFLIATALWPARQQVALLAAGVAAFLPGLVLNGSAITNDTLTVVLTSGALVAALHPKGQPASTRRGLLVGMLYGLALAIKPVALGVGPALAMALLWPALRARGLRAAVRLAIVLTAPAILLMAAWAAINLAVYGSPSTAGAAASLNTIETTPSLAGALVTNLVFSYASFWLGEPTSFTVGSTWLPIGLLLYLVPLFAVAGLIHVRRETIHRDVAGVLALAVAGQLAFTLLSPALVGSGFITPGRYFYSAVAAIAVLLAAGAWLEFPGARLRPIVGAAWLGSFVVVIALLATSPPFPVRGPVGAPGQGSQVKTVSASGSLQGLTLAVDRMAFDPGCNCTWVHVVESYDGAGRAELAQGIDLDDGRSLLGASVYAAGTHLPETLSRGDHLTGWMRVPVDPARVGSAGDLQVVFFDTAVDDYATVADVRLRVGP